MIGIRHPQPKTPFATTHSATTAAATILLLTLAATGWTQLQSLYTKPENTATRWATFENPKGEKGRGALENKGAKGHPFDSLTPGETKTLLDLNGSGTITRIWMTVNDRTSDTLRALRLDMYWDGAKTPAVAVPLGDFFGAILGKPVPFQSALFCNPEGRSFNCYIPMPFRKSARVTITNDSDYPLRLLFYDIDYLIDVQHGPQMLYFHAYWHRQNPTKLGKDFEILPKVKGSGRFLGDNIGINTNPDYPGWWGEGEVKMYVDGDEAHPTIVGTGTEDYIGTGWGQKTYSFQYQGCLISDKGKGQYTFYRYHIPDPIYFDKDIRVTIQQMGGDAKTRVLAAQKKGVPLTPVSASWRGKKGEPDHFVRLLGKDKSIDIQSDEVPDKAWTNYYRQDDVSAVAFFYLDRPENGLPPLAPVAQRTAAMKTGPSRLGNR